MVGHFVQTKDRRCANYVTVAMPMQISSNMAKISFSFECYGSDCTSPIVDHFNSRPFLANI
jgi:hypothetical protein